MSQLYKVYNAAVPTTAAMVTVATGTAIKTLLQLTAPSNNDVQIIAWGIDFETVPTAHVHASLIHTTTVAGTGMTAVVPTVWQDGPAAVSVAGFSPTAEGTVAATTRSLDTHLLMSNSYAWEFSLEREPEIPASGVCRIRVVTTASVNALCWLLFRE